MEDQEETLVLNYIDESFALSSEPEPGEAPNLKEGFDENQNPKVVVKKEVLETVSPKTKTLKVVLEAIRDLSAKKLALNSSPEKESLKKIKLSPNGIKALYPKNLAQNFATKTIKIEHTEDDISEGVVKNKTDSSFSKESDDIEVKYENIQQIHTEFKYESESEELIKKTIKLSSPDDKNKNITSEKQLSVIDLKQKNKLLGGKIFKCTHCLYLGQSKANLDRHSLIHKDPSEITWYKCTECEYKSKYDYQLQSHSLVHKNPEEIEYFECPHCEIKCSRKTNLRNHIRSIHSNRVNTFKCAECSYSTFSKDRLVAHVKMHSREVFTCHLCKFVTKRQSYLASHLTVKHTVVEKPFPCDTCSYKGKTKKDLDNHYGRMHSKDKLHTYQCNHCQFNSIYKKNLEFHMLHMHQNSEGFQKFICGHCNKEFAYKNGLKTHIIRMHLKFTEDDWHKCQKCVYKCKEVNTLKRHIKRKHAPPKLHCKQCKFNTNRQKSLLAHMKTHDSDADQILKCPECPYRIIHYGSFKYHMKVLHGKTVSYKHLNKYHLKDEA